jgi:RNA polymerase sigma-54 factor
VELSLDARLEQQNRVSPSLIAVNQILALSSQELQEEIQHELESNPALEMDERKLCPTCGGSYKGAVCRRCLADGLESKSYNQDDRFAGNYSDEANYSEPMSSNWGGEEEFDPMTLVAAEMPLAERLLADLATSLPDEDIPIAEFLIGSLDEQGYLSITTEAVALTFNTDESRVIRILEELQQIAPAGVAARNPQECLLLQLRFLKEQGVNPPYVEEILEKYFTALGERKYGYIAQQMGLTNDDVKEAREFIKKNLNPYPAQGQTGQINGVRYSSGMQQVVPDVIISYVDEEFKVEVVESKRFFLRISPLYRQLAQEMAQTESEAEREHIRQYVNRAKLFLSNIEQRRQTILKISEALVKIQEEFLREGVRDLVPLTRSTLASYIGLHESTVSRATAGKYVMLPNRKVIPFADFFQKNLNIKDMIKEMIEKSEQAGSGARLTDQEIVQILDEKYNVSIARRTVAKYRGQLKILPSTLR